jgi:4-hydroxythreonine-4-phosphate dehydrogenase|uniref:4-hydroxythreonine-4-phosphate dehydrogenase PdxA n=1 Tax=Cephaloticoccus sp. TaxID=1985742 RepID=UPI004049704F
MTSKLAITCGDPAGIGPEIVADWLRANPAEAAKVAVIGPRIWLETLPEAGEKISVGLEDFKALPGKPNGEGALIALAAMELAAAGCREGRFTGVVTGPVSKAQLAGIGYAFPGQTEFFAARWGGTPVMGFSGDHLRVVLATWHIPLAKIPGAITPMLLERTVHAAGQLALADGIVAPRIAVCGLNPHAGEGGLLGMEENLLIDPVLDRLRAGIPGLSRALPGDTVFGRTLRGEFDVVVALYHDQGLGPLKTVDFDNAVNVTLGLPHVRTSPDHGTAFDLAGQGKASMQSFANAVKLARRLIHGQDSR